MTKKKTVAAYTLGCKVNLYDTESILQSFESAGYKIVDFKDFADVYIINTCTVTNLGAKKSRQIIRRAKRNNPKAIVVAAGCYSQDAPDEVSEIEGVNIVAGTKDRTKILEAVENYDNSIVDNKVTDVSYEREFEETPFYTIDNRARAYVKIQDGCDNFCSYCIIPYVRGRARSRNIDNIIKETILLAEKGYKEVVLTGICAGSYGKDLDGISLIDVIEKVHETSIERIRLSSLDPYDISDEFVERLRPLHKVCDHFHLSLQSGSNKTLKAMNRKYMTDEFARAVGKLREVFPNVGITSDVIVGFPGETEKDFIESYEFVKNINLSMLHVFPYSPKKGTKAADMKEQVASNIKTERAKKLGNLGDRLTAEFLENHVGSVQSVLIEQKTDEDTFTGHSTNYMTVSVKSEADLVNKIKDVRIDFSDGKIIYGDIITNCEQI